MTTFTIEFQDARPNEEVEATTVSPSGPCFWFFTEDLQDGSRVTLQLRADLVKAITRPPRDLDGDYTYTMIRTDSEPDFVVKSDNTTMLESGTETHALITEGQYGPVIIIRWDLVERITRTLTS